MFMPANRALDLRINYSYCILRHQILTGLIFGGHDVCLPAAATDSSSQGLAGEYCQVNVIQTTQPINGFIPLLLGHNLGARHLTPFAKCPRSKLAIVTCSRQVPTQPEQIAYHTVNRKKALRLSR